MQGKIELNLGCVVYSQSIKGVEAQWIFNNNGQILKGRGSGIRKSKFGERNDFEGQFEIIYMDQNGHISPSLNLTITFDSGVYNLIWKIDDRITDIGIGFEKDNKLIASYKKVNALD